MIKTYEDNIKKYDETIMYYKYDWLTWYFNMHNSISLQCEGKDLAKHCAIFAAQSINNSLVGNKKQFFEYVTTGNVKGLGKTKIEDIIACDGSTDCLLDILSGPKIKNFFMNLYQPDNPDYVTIDRHAMRVAGIDGSSPTKKQYIEIANAYINVAQEYNMIPNMLQAKLWCHFVQNIKEK
jgi:hypothetical protein